MQELITIVFARITAATAALSVTRLAQSSDADGEALLTLLRSL